MGWPVLSAGVHRCASALAVLVLLGGCATFQGYLDPEGPRYAGGAGRAADPEPGIRVVTFNTQYASHIPLVIQGLRDHPALRLADVVALQEIDSAGVEAVATALGMRYIYYPASHNPKARRDVGNAILSPWPMADEYKLLLPHESLGKHQRRAAVSARVHVEDRWIRVYALHLGSPVGNTGDQRREQADVVIADALRCSDPLLVAGDFNSKSLGEYFVAKGFAWPTRKVGRTVGWYSFDHVFTRSLRLRDQASAGVAREVDDASDHRPVWAVVVPVDPSR